MPVLVLLSHLANTTERSEPLAGISISEITALDVKIPVGAIVKF